MPAGLFPAAIGNCPNIREKAAEDFSAFYNPHRNVEKFRVIIASHVAFTEYFTRISDVTQKGIANIMETKKSYWFKDLLEKKTQEIQPKLLEIQPGMKFTNFILSELALNKISKRGGSAAESF
jgi:hypothetical protein